MTTAPIPGPLVLFGSGETSASGQRVFDWLFRRLGQPLRVSILETPAGFELNSRQVAQRIADFLAERLQNYVAPLLHSNVIFLGPGSPSYAVRQLRDSLAWHTLRSRHRLGAALALASAATIATGAFALPVYEIYKVGEDPHWKPGLDLFADFGLKLAVVPHWNNSDGGAELDTSRCFMGQERFAALHALLPADMAVLGLDEHTALAVDWAGAACHVLGRGSVTVLAGGASRVFGHGHSFALAELGTYRVPEPGSGLPGAVWQQALEAARAVRASDEPPAEVVALAERRQEARLRRDWAESDALRAQIEAQGWSVQDLAEGPKVSRRMVNGERLIGELVNW